MKLDWAKTVSLKKLRELYERGLITKETYEKAENEKYKVIVNRK